MRESSRNGVMTVLSMLAISGIVRAQPPASPTHSPATPSGAPGQPKASADAPERPSAGAPSAPPTAGAAASASGSTATGTLAARVNVPAAPAGAPPELLQPPPSPPTPAVQAAALPSIRHEPAPLNREAPLETGPVPVKGLWNPILYGFVEFDAAHDSTQSYLEVPANVPIRRPETFEGSHGRTSFAGRNSRFGIRLTAPEVEQLRPTALFEADFAGNQPGIAYPSSGSSTSEASNITNSTLRIRHFALKVESPWVDVLAGQYWQLFGWQTFFWPNTVEIKGIPGQIFGRAPQVRVSHTFKSDAVNLEVALAASRPPQRDSEIPDGQAGVRLAVNSVRGLRTIGATGTSVDPLGIGLSSTVRRLRVTELGDSPKRTNAKTGWGISADALLPILRGTLEHRANALTLNGSFAMGSGIADQYLALGPGLPSVAPLAGTTTTPTWKADIDPGIVAYDSHAKLQTIDWQSFMAGVQYYLPPSGKIWIASNASLLRSGNIDTLGLPAASTFRKTIWWDANVFWEVVTPVRVAVEYAQFRQTYADGVEAKNERVQFNAFYIF